MNKILTLLAVLALGIAPSLTFAANATPGKLIAPPALNVPDGGTIVTEVNFADGDVLGIIKKAIPSLGILVQSLAQVDGTGIDPETASLISNVKLDELTAAISGLKAVRVVVVKYGTSVPPDQLLKKFETGVPKVGTFSKILSGSAFSTPGGFALYAQPNNAGYIVVAYDSNKRTMYAARMLGFVDINKLISWANNFAKTVGIGQSEPQSPAPVPAAPNTQSN